MKEDLTFNEAYLMRLLNFKTLRDLNEWLNSPDNLEALAKTEEPQEYEEAARAERESEMVEELERLYALPHRR